KVPELGIDPQRGMGPIGKSLQTEIARLKDGATDILYLPNTRWFYGEESKGDERDQFASELASLADIYINDAFGSWQPHASTYDVARKMPSYAGMLLQKELANLRKVLEPERPFLAVIAGAKYDTKIGPLKALYQKVDHLILGGLMYNTFLAAKYGVHVEGISDEDKALAADLVALDKTGQKIIPLEHVVESDTLEGRSGGRHRTRAIESLAAGKSFRYIVDIDPASFSVERVKDVFQKARTIFLNAVVGFMPFFSEGSEALYRMVASNTSAMKLFAGGDTLQELRNLCPGIYLDGVDDPRTYYFTGGGSVLTAIENGSPYSIKPVEALMDENT
ncbi:MAG: phosphoglycerate kinase, partial [Deltaproteobacteria bacterium CG_4_10_14_3_um_filter_51_14]